MNLNLINFLLETSSDSSSSDDDDDENIGLILSTILFTMKNKSLHKILNKLTKNDFEIHFKIKFDTFNILLDNYKTYMIAKHSIEVTTLIECCLKYDLIIYCLYLTNTDNNLEKLLNNYKLNKLKIYHLFKCVRHYFLHDETRHLDWPKTLFEQEMLSENFYELSHIKNIIGVLCMHELHVKDSKTNTSYICLLQIIIDSNNLIRYCEVGQPNVTDNNSVLRNSNLHKNLAKLQSTNDNKLHANKKIFTFQNKLLNHYDNDWLMTNYDKSGINLYKTIENTFKQLLIRFQRLTLLDDYGNYNNIIDVVKIICTIHNICEKMNDSPTLTK